MSATQTKKVRLTPFLLAAALFLSAHPAVSSDAILIRKSGDVEILPRGAKNFKKASAGAGLRFGDTVQTLKGAKAQILFPGGGAILIKESTSIKLSGKKGAILAHVPKGEFLIGIKKRLRIGESFRVKTPAAVASVRGTLFWGLSDDELNSTYACFQHTIEISAKGKKTLLQPGEKTSIAYGKAPGKKEQANIPVEYMDTFEVDGTIEGFKDMLHEK